MKLLGRQAECDLLDGALADAFAGRSRVVVLRGEAGAGKSALLDYVFERAADRHDWHVATAVGVESEMELAHSGIHQLCAPLLDGLDRLPEPQSAALATVFGRETGPPPDPFLVALATLTLLAEVSDRQPVACIVDDAQWLDAASAQVLAFVARRLLAEPIAIVCAARSGIGDKILAGLPELSVGGLGDSDARALLLYNVHGPLDAAVCEQIIKESHGNPLALLELPRTWNLAEFAGGFGLPDGQSVVGKIEQSYARRLQLLPSEAQLLVLAAAAEPLGDSMLLRSAAETLGIDLAVAEPAQDAGLLTVGRRVEFAHPLVRSASYRSASAGDRRRVHRALAKATDAERDPDRRAWHLARAAAGPGEDVAAELERSAGQAQARGGVAAGAAFLERATILTLDPMRRTDRALAAASANLQAGAFDAVRQLLSVAEAGAITDMQQARIDLIGADLAFVTNRGSDAPSLLLKAAKRLEPIDADLSRATYLQALASAMFAGRLALGGGVLEVAGDVDAAPPPTSAPRASDFLLDGLVADYTRGYAAGMPLLRKALDVFDTDVPAEEKLRWYWVADIVAQHLWDDDRWQLFTHRHVQLARDVGALSELPIALTARAFFLQFAGELVEAAALVQELQAAMEATGTTLAPYAGMGLEAFRGRHAETTALVEATIEDVSLRGEGNGIAVAQWATAVLNNGVGDYQTAMTAAQSASDYPGEIVSPNWALVELVEAAARSGKSETAAEALRRLAEVTSASGTNWALGVEARSRALLSDGDAAECLYRESIERLRRTSIRADLARSHLLYGEWLRRQRRRVDARAQLRVAHEMLDSMGMDAFAERARRELRATGETTRKRSVAAADEELTAQEALIARMARDGLSNPEIAARMFISARTVQYHLRKVFAKLGIESRTQLDRVLPD